MLECTFGAAKMVPLFFFYQINESKYEEYSISIAHVNEDYVRCRKTELNNIVQCTKKEQKLSFDNYDVVHYTFQLNKKRSVR